MPTRRGFISAVAGAAYLTGGSAHGGVGPVDRPGDVAFQGKSGINVFWPWGGPIVANSGDPNTRYAPADVVFGPLANGPWDDHVTRSVYDQCVAVGIDHFRIQCNPGPWMQAIRENDRAYMEALFARFDATIEHTLEAGLGVVVDPYLTGYVRDAPATVLTAFDRRDGRRTPGFLAYRAALAAFAERYQKYDPALVAFELFNEPPDPEQFSGDWPNVLQPELYRTVRAIAPRHTIVCTGARWSSIPELCALDPSSYDRNVLWTIHPLIPAPASQQGYPYSQYKYVVGIHYPPRPEDKSGAIDDMHRRVSADETLGPHRKAALRDSLTGDLNAYFDTPQGLAWINAQFDLASNWCRRHAIPPASIYVGEYGVTRSNQGFPGTRMAGYQGGAREDRARYLRDLRSAIGVHGFRCAPDHLDTLDYGLTQAADARIGPWDPLLLSAISPHDVRLTF